MVMMAFLPSVCYGNFWNIPSNIRFDINFFNDSRCIESTGNSTEFIFYCDETIESCCETTVSKIAPFNFPQLNVCYDIQTNNNDSFVRYNCDEANINDMSTVEIFGFIGIVLIIFIMLMIVYLIISKLFCRNRNRYEDL